VRRRRRKRKKKKKKKKKALNASADTESDGSGEMGDQSNHNASSARDDTKSPGSTRRRKKMAEPSNGKITKKSMDALDFTKRSGRGDGSTANGGAKRTVVVESYGQSEMDAPVQKKKGWSLGVTNIFKRLSGSKVLDKDDLDAPMQAMKDKLVSKNVASDIADQVCDSVQAKLIGQKVGTFERTNRLVIEALSEALTRILTPNKSIDVLRSALEAKEQGRPYVIVFIGVNGVGKSTSLSKVCHYLLQNKLSVMMAACDTFRSGAVEQLKEHGRRIGVEVFDKGYSKYPSQVAQAAVKQASQSGVDVVLIDTAGRMQNNTKLMHALAVLVAENEPDLCLFVGEALVGNDGVDQLMCFNKALVDHGSASNPHAIDGIILTKVDTIDDKVGAALSMVYRSKVPIVFVGTGQKYTNLKRLNVDAVIEALFK